MTQAQIQQVRDALKELTECAGCATCSLVAESAIAVLDFELDAIATCETAL